MAHLVPVVPESPPGLLPGPSSMRLLRRLVVITFAGLGFLLILGRAVADRPQGTLVLAVVVAAVAGAVVFGLRRAQNRQFEELSAGYTLSGRTFGVVSFRPGRVMRPRAAWADGNSGVPWDVSGVWRLSELGAVLAPPDRDVEPPGFYPSPHRPDRFEFWTGCNWSGLFRASPP